MPTVLRVDGFIVMIFLPGREHGPAHVHVFKDSGEVVIWLNRAGAVPTVRSINGMSFRMAQRALDIVDEHIDMLREQWRKYHA
jgi:hypothetical protein